MKFSIRDNGWLRNEVKFEKEDWDNGLAMEMNDLIKGFEKRERYFDVENKVWVVSDRVMSAINKEREVLRKGLEEVHIDMEVDDFEDIWSR